MAVSIGKADVQSPDAMSMAVAAARLKAKEFTARQGDLYACKADRMLS